jgi:hypothetical protein
VPEKQGVSAKSTIGSCSSPVPDFILDAERRCPIWIRSKSGSSSHPAGRHSWQKKVLKSENSEAEG